VLATSGGVETLVPSLSRTITGSAASTGIVATGIGGADEGGELFVATPRGCASAKRATTAVAARGSAMNARLRGGLA
jgi:hypothetical protein